MSKNKNKKTITMEMPKLTGGRIIEKISSMVNLKKGGKINGSKRERKVIKSICVHHVIDKHGRLRNTTHPTGQHNERCQCAICKDQYKAGYYTEQEIAQVYGMGKEVLSQMKLLAVVDNCDDKSINTIAQMNLLWDEMPKTYFKLAKVAIKAGQKKQEKKKKHNKSLSRSIWNIE